MEHPFDAAALQAASHDEALNLRSALPDPVHPELAQEALGDVRAQVAAPAKGLYAAIGTDPRPLGREELCHRRLVVDELEIGTAVGKLGDLEGEKPCRRRVGRRIREGE